MSTKKAKCMTEKTLQMLESISRKKLTVGNLLWVIREGEEISLAEFSKKLGESPVQFIRITIQEEVEKAGLHLDIQVKAA